jgi:hypothetical protein
MRDWIEIGCTPYEEECIPMNTNPIEERKECQRFVEFIRKHIGEEPYGAELRVCGNNHDFGIYYEVRCYYDDNEPEALEYALKAEGELPGKWNAEIKPTAQELDA